MPDIIFAAAIPPKNFRFLGVLRKLSIYRAGVHPRESSHISGPPNYPRTVQLSLKDSPEEFVEVSMLHVLKHHDERVSIYTHSIEFNNVVVLQVGEQLGLPLEVLPGRQVGILQSLKEEIKRFTSKFGENKPSFTRHWGINHPLHPVNTSFFPSSSKQFHGSEIVNLLNLGDDSITSADRCN